jgi:hypothetical protein
MHRDSRATWSFQLACFAITAALLSATAGCGAKSDTGRVRGTVRLDGKPLASGNILTLPPAGRGATGVVENGEFQLKTGASEGIVPGTHKVAISAHEQPQNAGPEAPVGKSLLPEKYSNPDSSGLTIDVKAGETATPTLELKSQ